jgi:hypothetical protein
VSAKRVIDSIKLEKEAKFNVYAPQRIVMCDKATGRERQSN